jgi:hypothetical protein
MTTDRIVATALAAFASASAVPLGLAQLDFAGLFSRRSSGDATGR